jgi:hypothetical protein
LHGALDLSEALVETRLNALRAQGDAPTQALQAAYEETLVWLKQATAQKQVTDTFSVAKANRH